VSFPNNKPPAVTCAEEGCARKKYAKGFCLAHYKRRLRLDVLPSSVPTRTKLVNFRWNLKLVKRVKDTSHALGVSQTVLVQRLMEFGLKPENLNAVMKG
jgi:hypothetical protein